MRRITVGGGFIALVIVCVILSQYPWFTPFFGLAVAIVASVGLWEYYKMARQSALWLGIGLGVFLLLVRYVQIVGGVDQPITAAALAICVFALFCWSLFRQENALANLATGFFGLIYVIIPFALIFDILFRPDGWWWFFLVVGATVFTDMGAYFCGRAFGKHKIVPMISPKKTVEGTLCGIVIGIAFAIVWYFFGMNQIEFWEAVVLGLVFAVIGQLGDLAESVLKRDVGVKDSNKIPGLGGILDIVDSLLFNFPLLFVYLKVFG